MLSLREPRPDISHLFNTETLDELLERTGQEYAHLAGSSGKTYRVGKSKPFGTTAYKAEIMEEREDGLEPTGEFALLKVGTRKSYKFIEREMNIFKRLEGYMWSNQFIHPTDYFEDQGYRCIAFPFLPVTSVERYVKIEGPMLAPVAARILYPVAKQIELLHGADIFSADIKPDNMLLPLREEGGFYDRKDLELGRAQATLADFGIAHHHKMESINEAGFVLGTPTFMAPEVLLGHYPTAQSEVYALAMSALKMLTGTDPYAGLTEQAVGCVVVEGKKPLSLKTLEKMCSAKVNEVIERGIIYDARYRTRSALEFAAQFLHASGYQGTKRAERLTRD